jgi:hypothetical protein
VRRCQQNFWEGVLEHASMMVPVTRGQTDYSCLSEIRVDLLQEKISFALNAKKLAGATHRQ